MGQYINKVMKVDYDAMFLGPIGFYEFWYKPSYSSYFYPSEIKREQMREITTDRLQKNHPNGMKYACHAPTDYDDKWVKDKKVALYRVPDDIHLSPVASDEGRAWDATFQLKNVVGVVWGTKGGKKHVDQSSQAIWDIVKEQYFSNPDHCSPREAALKNNSHTLKQVQEHLPEAHQKSFQDLSLTNWLWTDNDTSLTTEV